MMHASHQGPVIRTLCDTAPTDPPQWCSLDLALVDCPACRELIANGAQPATEAPEVVGQGEIHRTFRTDTLLSPPKAKWRWTNAPGWYLAFHVPTAPHWIARLMQRLVLGIRWEKLTEKGSP